MNLKDRFLHFLDRYAAKDLPTLMATFSSEVKLRDWNVSVQGHDGAMQFLRQNFDQADTLSIQVFAMYESANSVVGELRILVDGCIELFVVDIIEFDAAGGVRSVRSYKGRGD